ncbi:unnamed protein product [Durusdinium trenchii]|uniref:Uncharacterized protein n=1 Tax=Durusdinium trenchii TaxID=1381693 RepID=A0ABP0Q323_9DINO
MDDAGNEGEARRASSSSSGGGGLPVKPVKRLSQAASDSSGDSPRRGASPREAEDRRKPHGKTATEAIQAIPQRRRGASEETSSPSVSRTPSRGKKLLNGNDRTPSPKGGASKGARALSARGERSNTSPETTEQKAQSRPASTSPLRGMHVRSASPVASTKCSKEREKIGRARAAAAGVKKPPVEAPKSVTGSFLLEQSLASKELLNKQRKEWMAAVKRTQDSTAKYVAQKRIAATNPSVASEAHERAQLIRRAQEDNWLDHLRAEESKAEPRSKTPPKARSQPPMPKSSVTGPTKKKVVGEFKKMLLEKGGNFVRAWRYLLDPDCRGQLTLPQLAQKCRELGFQENVRTLWYALNGPYGDAAVTMGEVDSETEAILMRFRAALLSRALELGFPKKYTSTEVPDLVAHSMLRILDLDRSYRLTRREFVCAVVLQKLATPEEAPLLFEMLCHGEPGCHSHHSANAVVKVDALKWLYLVAARAEDLPSTSEGKKGANSEKSGFRTLRRVWTETPAVFKRLREEQEKKVEEMLKLQKDAPQVEAARPAQNFDVHNYLYEDAKRRENARREASEPAPIKAVRAHDPEYIERLAQKPAPKEAEEASGKKRPVNMSRLTQLADERRMWYEQRERQREAKLQEEAQVCEQAALQLREEVARKSRMTIAVRRWRQMLAQVVIIAAFAPGLNAEAGQGGVWQLLALAAGSSKAQLRLAEDHDDALSVAGGASLCWKDRARITMAARLKLLVRFKQVEEHWGCALDELLEDMNPEPPDLQQLKPEGAKAPVGLAAMQQSAPFEFAERITVLESEPVLSGDCPQPKPAKPRLLNERPNGTPPRRGRMQPSAVPQRPQQLTVFEK